jgi:hypothetical protein
MAAQFASYSHRSNLQWHRLAQSDDKAICLGGDTQQWQVVLQDVLDFSLCGR